MKRIYLFIFALLCPCFCLAAEEKFLADTIEVAYEYTKQKDTFAIESLTGSPQEISFSWTQAERKIPRFPSEATIQKARPIQISAPRNDFESFQLLVRPELRTITGIAVQVTDLTCADGAMISKENIQLRYGYYHFVTYPSDKTCAKDWYEDALVPIEKGADGYGSPLNVLLGENFPIFVTVYVPEETPAGVYHGTVQVSNRANAFQAQIPFSLRVWNFSQPKKNRFETAYGFYENLSSLYHNCKTEEERRAVWEMYLKTASDHRISFYDSVPFDHFKMTVDKKNLKVNIDFEAFDREMTRIREKYNITHYSIPVEGIGSGTFLERQSGSFAGFKQGEPQYDLLMKDYGGKLQGHLEEKGWLKGTYVYWFDEPQDKDYEFVANGMSLLKKYMPKLERMLTEDPGEAFCNILEEKGTNIDIWCPLSHLYDEETAQTRKEKGERFWWYVCCGPKDPFCTEFTDHRGHELRLWHWQAFERGITGSLIWATNWWTTKSCFPDQPQNPYLDPMAYVDRSLIEERQFWANGDGRFFYPPLSAAVPGENNGNLILDEPVCSIRFESLREGIEDYEILLTLKETLEAKRDCLSSKEIEKIEQLFNFSDLSTDMSHFTNDPGRIYLHRQKVCEAIETLQEK